MSAIDRLEELRETNSSPDDTALWALFDTLEAAATGEILGKWRGGGLDTGHWLLPRLAQMRWYGKWFVTERDARPLICTDADGNLYSSTLLNGEASLQMIGYRGRVSAAVVYDGVPMFGHLRRINEVTLLGVVDGKVLTGRDVLEDGRHQFFYLERIQRWPAPFVEGDAASDIWTQISL